MEFGRHFILDEVEGGIVTRYEILERPHEHGQAVEAVSHHQQIFGRAPRPARRRSGRAFRRHRGGSHRAGVKFLATPASGKLSQARQALERTRRWKRGYRWRAGIESLRRDYGWRQSACHGQNGMERWLGLGVMASNLRRIALARKAEPLVRANFLRYITACCYDSSLQAISHRILVPGQGATTRAPTS